ncbi:hypothetical protein BaRGS_00027473 [Batillaria attramentaria]|uniref:C2H2-type domain-containing protein n=1 Tax=Batillaria attramentaria TaxID=370345 RepID=A0ABD0K2Z1_9CAEN
MDAEVRPKAEFWKDVYDDMWHKAVLCQNLADGTASYEGLHAVQAVSSQTLSEAVAMSRVSRTDKGMQCPVCHKTMQQQHQFVGHMNMHYNLSPFKCDLCLKSFPYKTSLARHRRTHHKSNESSGSSPSY